MVLGNQLTLVVEDKEVKAEVEWVNEIGREVVSYFMDNLDIIGVELRGGFISGSSESFYMDTGRPELVERTKQHFKERGFIVVES